MFGNKRATGADAGTLRVRLSHGVGLKSADSNGFSDPYCKLTVQCEKGKVTHKSKIIYKELNPRWEEDFTWHGRFSEMVNTPMHVECWDYDRLSMNDSLGDANLDLRNLQGLDQGMRVECSVQLRDKQARPGEVFFVVQFDFDNPNVVGGVPPSQMSPGGMNMGVGGVAVGTPYGHMAHVPERIRNVFAFFDTNRSGYLDYRELRNALTRYGIDSNVIQAAEVVRRYDDAPDGKLELAEFSELVKDLEQGVVRSMGAAAGRSPYGNHIPARVAAAFDQFDTNRSGFLDYGELRNALTQYGVVTSEAHAANLVRVYDDRPDGKLDIEEFANLIRDIEAGVTRQGDGSRFATPYGGVGGVGPYNGGVTIGRSTPSYTNQTYYRPPTAPAYTPQPTLPPPAPLPAPLPPGGGLMRDRAVDRPPYRDDYREYGPPPPGYGGYRGRGDMMEMRSCGPGPLGYLLDVAFRAFVYSCAAAAIVAPDRLFQGADSVAQSVGQESASAAINVVPVRAWYALIGVLVVLLLININCCGLRRPCASCFDCLNCFNFDWRYPNGCMRCLQAFFWCWRPSYRSYYDRFDYDEEAPGYGPRPRGRLGGYGGSRPGYAAPATRGGYDKGYDRVV